jgi:hypothetical protein
MGMLPGPSWKHKVSCFSVIFQYLFLTCFILNESFVRVMAQVSCSVQVPKSSRANEGMLFINVEMSTMAAEHFEAGRLGQQGIEVNRLVERCIKGNVHTLPLIHQGPY